MIVKNQSKVIVFAMKNTDGTQNTSATPACKVSKDTGNPATCTNAAVRKSTTNKFHITLTATEMNADIVMFSATATGCQDVDYVLFPTSYPLGGNPAFGSYASLLDNTLSGLIRALRVRLDDLDEGQYSDEELHYSINLAYRETVVSSKCHKARSSISLVENTHTYDCGDIFEPISVYKGTAELDGKSIGDIGINIESWDSTAAGTPTTWVHLSGGSIRLYPTPGATPGSITVYGYSSPTILTNVGDTPDAIPDAFAIQSILDRAEAEARMLRITTNNNGALSTQRLAQWKDWCSKIYDSVKGDG